MPSHLINFTPWIWQDDVQSFFVDGKNVDGIKTSSGLKLWPKVNKAIKTNYPIRGIWADQRFDWGLEYTLIWWNNWEIYRIDGTDITPVYTLTNGADIVNIIYGYGFFYIFYVLTNDVDIARVSQSAVWNGTISTYIDETFATWVMNGTQSFPYVFDGRDSLILGTTASTIYALDLTTGTPTSYNILDEPCVWVTLQGSVIMLYSQSGNVYQWNGLSTNVSAKKNLGSRLRKVVQKWAYDYITTEDWQLYIWSGFSFQQISRPRKSNKLDDNSDYYKIVSFEEDLTDFRQNRTMCTVHDDLYIYSSDKVKGIYKYGNVQPGTEASLHKIITENHEGTAIDYIYDMFYYERILQRLYFSYKAGSTYGVDYIDTDSLETATSGYIITSAWRANTTYKKAIQWLRKASSYTDWANYIKIYWRKDGWDWELIYTINSADIIESERPIKSLNWKAFDRYIELQYKFELYNGNGTNNTPILHEFEEFYEIDNPR